MKLDKPPAVNKTGPSRVVTEVDTDLDLSATAKKVNEAKTPHSDKGHPPGLSVTFFAKLDKDSAKKAEEAAGKVKGVDSKDTKADAAKGEIRVRIKGDEKVTFPDIQKALKDAGIEAKLTKDDKKS